MSRATLLLLFAASFGCATPDQGEDALTLLDVPVYAADIHPLLEARCASLDCHGASGRPLRLYSEIGLRARADLRATPAGEAVPITDEELNDNVYALSAIDPRAPSVDRHLLLLKVLGDAGGVHHLGGSIWPSRGDVAYLCVRAWLAGDMDVPSCEAAKDRDALPPP